MTSVDAKPRGSKNVASPAAAATASVPPRDDVSAQGGRGGGRREELIGRPREGEGLTNQDGRCSLGAGLR